jgi:hypothetical protein
VLLHVLLHGPGREDERYVWHVQDDTMALVKAGYGGKAVDVTGWLIPAHRSASC